MKRHLFAAAVALIAMAGTARAQTPEATPVAAPADPTSTPPAAASGGDAASQFGLQGQIAISGELQLQLSHQSNSGVGNQPGTSSNTIIVQPALDYFVAPNISVGGTLTIAHSAAGGSGTGSLTAIGLAARAGYNLHLAPQLSFWPQLQLGYAHLSFDPGSVTGYTVTLGIFAPLLYHVTPHLFVGIGPAFTTELLSKANGQDNSKETDFGLMSVVGGYFGP